MGKDPSPTGMRPAALLFVLCVASAACANYCAARPLQCRADVRDSSALGRAVESMGTVAGDSMAAWQVDALLELASAMAYRAVKSCASATSLGKALPDVDGGSAGLSFSSERPLVCDINGIVVEIACEVRQNGARGRSRLQYASTWSARRLGWFARPPDDMFGGGRIAIRQHDVESYKRKGWVVGYEVDRRLKARLIVLGLPSALIAVDTRDKEALRARAVAYVLLHGLGHVDQELESHLEGQKPKCHNPEVCAFRFAERMRNCLVGIER